ncbi:MAG: stage II sporulation protein M [Planctomycetales bacterium]|nr:stage II sporulation protein M [Planctomycetales bacterium]
MKAAELLESRKNNWRELDQLCSKMEQRRYRKSTAESVSRFAALYRAACADLALADAYHLPPGTVHYLHQLVGRAHNQLYRSRLFNFHAWGEEMFRRLPQRLFCDNALRLSFCVFWGIFLISMYLASDYSPVPDFAEAVAGKETLEQMELMYEEPISSNNRGAEMFGFMAGFYVWNNAGIGLRCFAAGLVYGVGGLFALVFNAALLGTIFGHMTTVSMSDNFFHFVTAHGPFELTAVVLSAAAGMRLGFSLVDTGGLRRGDSLRKAAGEAMPTAMAAVILFILAAGIEGFISPSPLPYSVKAAVFGISCALLLFYFVLLGLPRVDDELG